MMDTFCGQEYGKVRPHNNAARVKRSSAPQVMLILPLLSILSLMSPLALGNSKGMSVVSVITLPPTTLFLGWPEVRAMCGASHPERFHHARRRFSRCLSNSAASK
jgi:hypothetical protein